MASNKRPPLEMDDLTNSLKQSSGRGVYAFFPSQPATKELIKPSWAPRASIGEGTTSGSTI